MYISYYETIVTIDDYYFTMTIIYAETIVPIIDDIFFMSTRNCFTSVNCSDYPTFGL